MIRYLTEGTTTEGRGPGFLADVTDRLLISYLGTERFPAANGARSRLHYILDPTSVIAAEC